MVSLTVNTSRFVDERNSMEPPKKEVGVVASMGQSVLNDFSHSFKLFDPSSSYPSLENVILTKYGLTSEDLTVIRLYLSLPANLDKINRMANGQPLHIRKNEENKLPRSLVFIPEKDSRHAQIFVLLKEHNVDLLGEGAFTKATKALGFTWDAKGTLHGPLGEKAFLSSMAEDAAKAIETMKLLKGQYRCLIGDVVVRYTGDVDRAASKRSNVPKVGILMDLMKSDFAHFSQAATPTTGKLNTTSIKILRDAAEGLREMHQLNLIHNDVKPANIAVTDRNTGKIADFGLSGHKGQIPPVIASFSPPEIYMSPKNKSNYNSKADSFQFGLLLMSIAGYQNYVDEYRKIAAECMWERSYSLSIYADNIFYKFKTENSGPFVKLISDCIQIDPKKRIDFDVIVTRLERCLDAHLLSETLSSANERLKLDTSTIPLVELKNGAQVPDNVVAPVMKALNNLHLESYEALICLRAKCEDGLKNPDKYRQELAILQETGLIQDNGNVPDIVKNILFSACQDNTIENKLMLNTPVLNQDERQFREFLKDQQHSKAIDQQDIKFKDPKEKELYLQGRFQENETKFSKLNNLLDEHFTESSPDINQKPASNPLLTREQLKTVLDILDQNAARVNSQTGLVVNDQAKEASTPSDKVEEIPQRDSGFYVSAGSSREKPKPKTVDWEQLRLRAGVTPEGHPQIGVGVPVNIGGYGVNVGIDVQTDLQTLKNLWKAISGGKIDPQSKRVPTNFGDYQVKWYRMGHSVLSSEEGSDYKVKIKDCDGNKHTLWVKGAFNLEDEVNTYLNTLISKKVSNETQDFSRRFNQLIEQNQIQSAQQLLQDFWTTHSSYLSSDFNKVFQNFLNEGFAKQRVENLQNASIEAIVEQIRTCVHTSLLSSADYLEQELLKNLLVKKLLETRSEQELQFVFACLADLKKGRYVDPLDLNENVSFPNKEGFVGMRHADRNEMRNRAMDCRDRILNAYKELVLVIRSGEDSTAAEKTFMDEFQKAEQGGREGFGIKLADGRTLGDLFNENYPEVVACAKGKSSWLNQYHEQNKAELVPFISEKERRSLSIVINLDNYNEAVKILNDSKTDLKREIAFKVRYEAAKNLIKQDLNAEDLVPGADLSFLNSVIAHYEWCEGSLVCSDAADAIDKLLKPYSETHENKKIIKIHEMTENERLLMRKQAEVIAKHAKVGGELHRFSQDALSYNYQILADSYGKFAGLFLTNTLLEYGQQKKNKALITGVQVINTWLPSLFQNILMVPLAYYQGNGRAAVRNIIQGTKNDLNFVGYVKEHKANLFDIGWKLVTTTLPFIYDPEDQKNRSLYQNLHLASTMLSKWQSCVQGSLQLNLLTSAPFDCFEFLVDEPSQPNNRWEWTWIDRSKSFIHESLMQIVPNFLQPGNLPENKAYYAVKHFVANAGSALEKAHAYRRFAGPHGDNRDLKAAAIYAVSATAMQGWMGKFEEESCFAMLKNSQYYFRKQQYRKALPSIIRLQTFLEQNETQRKQEEQFIKLQMFATEAYYFSLYQTVLQLTEQQKFEDAEPYLERLKEAVETGFELSITKMNNLLKEESFVFSGEVSEICEKLKVLQLSSLLLVVKIIHELKL